MSGMVICRITCCSSADRQALAEDNMNSDTAWVEGVVCTFNDSDLDTDWGLLNPFEYDLDI